MRVKNFPNYRYLRVRFLSKNTTSVLQPIDAGVIACIKRRYQQRLYDRAVDLIDGRYLENPCDVDLKLRIKWVYEIRFRMERRAISNYWVCYSQQGCRYVVIQLDDLDDCSSGIKV